jgi:hypothetical protein
LAATKQRKPSSRRERLGVTVSEVWSGRED